LGYENSEGFKVKDMDKGRRYSILVDKGVAIWSSWLKEALSKIKKIETTNITVFLLFPWLNLLFILWLIKRARKGVINIHRIKNLLNNIGLGIISLFLFFSHSAPMPTCYKPIIPKDFPIR